MLEVKPSFSEGLTPQGYCFMSTLSYLVNFLIFDMIVSSLILPESNLTQALANFNLKSNTPSDLSKAALTKPSQRSQIMAGMLRSISFVTTSVIFHTSSL
jgi:hypothetical protein